MIYDRQLIPTRRWSLCYLSFWGFFTCFCHRGVKSPESARECASPAGWWAASTPAAGSPGDSSGLTPTEQTGGLSVSQVLQVEEQFVLDYRQSHSFRMFSTSQGSNVLFLDVAMEKLGNADYSELATKQLWCLYRLEFHIRSNERITA